MMSIAVLLFLYYKQISQFLKMGNQNQNGSNSQDIDISYDYNQIDKNQYGTILEHKQTKQSFILKEYTYVTNMIYEQERHRLQKEMQDQTCQNILKVKKIKTHTYHGICSTTYKIYVIYEYAQVTLYDEIMARQKECKIFDQNQLWSILQCCNIAFTQLKPIVSMNPHQIFITPDGVLKIIHNDLFDENYRYVVNQNYYYAPQKIRNFNKIDSQISLIKEAVFSMGMTLLQAALLQNALNCYNYKDKIFEQTQLQNLLYILSQRYSSDFIQILESMLSMNPDDRPAYHEIQKLLDNFWMNQEDELGEGLQQGDINEQSLKIQAYNDKKIIFTSTDGIYKNTQTINSHHKDSVKIQNSLEERYSKGKIVQSKFQEQPVIKPESKVTTFTVNKKQSNPINPINPKIVKNTAQSKQHESTSSAETTNKRQSLDENLYTDPKLLLMIKKDLEDINKLKQSTLKETIKYSFLYPQTESIFSSIKDIKLASLHANMKSRSNQRDQEDRSLKEMQVNVQEFSIPGKGEKNTLFKKQKVHIEKIYDFEGMDNEGKMYKGQMINGKKNGWGKLYFEDEAYYEGQFKNDEINGRGILYYCQNKPAYDGMWVQGKFHGKGILFNRDPFTLTMPFDYRDFDEVQQFWIKYQGQFFEDCKSGHGKLYLSNNQILQGNFQNDQINGKCNFISMQGEFITGTWQQNKLINIQL